MSKCPSALRLLVVLIAAAGAPSAVAHAGPIDSSAKYFFTTGTVQSDLGSCGTLLFEGWDGEFSRAFGGARFTGGFVSYTNLVCFAGVSGIGTININAYFQAPILQPVLDEFGQPIRDPFPIFEEVGRNIVQQEAGVIDFRAVFTPNTGDPRGDADGLFLPAINKTLWVPENSLASFFFLMQVGSPIQLLSVVPADQIGFVTSGTDPFAPNSALTDEERAILALPGGPTSVPEPSVLLLLISGLALSAKRHYVGYRK